jgi:glyoxalase family protein
MTFFPWPGARRGTRGVGQVIATSFAVPTGSIDYWKSRFKERRVLCEDVGARFDDAVLRLADPDGLLLELIASAHLDDVDLNYESEIRREFAIHGFHAPTLEVQSAKSTEQLLQTIGFELQNEEKSRRRFSLNERSTSASVDLIERSDGHLGVNSAGTVHHIAFRCANQEEQLQWRNQLVDLGSQVTPVIDRQYFHSIYFREPGGILFEIATDGPGFTVDEPVEQLGETLKLPPQYEQYRAKIEKTLPPISLHRQSSS